jgi:molybdopterin-guanine dinucleotide biosynthesis protein A
VLRAITSAAIIAGGQATRFGGQDKSRLVIEGRPIIVRQVDVLQRVASELLVVGGAPDRFADLALRVVPDECPGTGPLGGVYTALLAASNDRVIVVGCDLPFLHAGLLGRLAALAGAERDGAWVRGPRGLEPLLGCYRRDARLAILQTLTAGQLQLNRLGTVLRMAEVGEDELRTFGRPERLLANVNSPADYARVQYPPS